MTCFKNHVGDLRFYSEDDRKPQKGVTQGSNMIPMLKMHLWLWGEVGIGGVCW